ncbi:hypothetical protein JZ751_003315 [Albula glossodonta]|uniref:Rad4 beta-hairpin domain-containing protein n=1 Tax=Albula glossodonta TaxID=121402 RepID=A0A8T2N6P6_9TELE|nr:hypothetical protein JZ751_003315 [Albula glossodonta]
MVKQKGSSDAASKTTAKKLQQIVKGKAGGVKRKTNAENVADDISEESVVRKAKPRSRASKPKGKTADHTSKYFQDQLNVKEEPVAAGDSDSDDIITPCTEDGEVEMKVEKEEEEDSDDEEEKREAEFETYLRRMMNRFNKDVLVDTHKVHLLCLVANGIFRNRLCSEPDLLAIGLSVLPTHFTVVTPEQADDSFLCRLLKWFQATFSLAPDLPQMQGDSPCAALERRFETLSARSHQEMTHLFLVILRSLQLFCRLVLSLHPIPLKPPSAKVSPGVKRPVKSGEAGAGSGGKRQRKSKVEKEKTESEAGAGQRPKNSRRRSVASKVSYKEDSSEGEVASDGEEFQMSEEGDSDESEGGAKARRSRKGKGKGKRVAPRRQRSKKEESSEEEEEEEEGEEEEVEGRSRRKRSAGEGVDEWLEVYLERAGRWVCLDVQRPDVGQPQQCSRQATQPLSYVLAVDGDGHLKDVSSRYDPTWMTSSRKRRLQANLLDKPLPTMVKGFSNRARKARQASEEQRDRDDLGLFGQWQTEEYQPPVAVDGKVPRNEYGNVYLFRPCMLPVGCVHVHLPNLHRKREKRVLEHWTLLVKGLLIRERLQRRYGRRGPGELLANEGEQGLSSGEEDKEGAETAAVTLATSWPQNRQEELEEHARPITKRERKGLEKGLFPFEKL